MILTVLGRFPWHGVDRHAIAERTRRRPSLSIFGFLAKAGQSTLIRQSCLPAPSWIVISIIKMSGTRADGNRSTAKLLYRAMRESARHVAPTDATERALFRADATSISLQVETVQPTATRCWWVGERKLNMHCPNLLTTSVCDIECCACPTFPASSAFS